MKNLLIKAKVEPVTEVCADLGEGAIWDYINKVLYWVDIYGKKLFVYEPVNRVNRVIKFNKEIGAVVPRKKGGVILAMKGCFVSYNLNTGKVKKLAIVEQNIPTNRFNDGKCDPAGRFWAGTMDFKASHNAGSLYYLDLDFSLRKIIRGITISNGITWNVDKKTMYYIDSPTYSVVSYDYNKETGNIKNKRVIIRINPLYGIPDGMTIDKEGMLWIALFGSGKISRWDPASGDLVGLLEIPGAKRVTSCSFGGNEMKDLYITTASHGLNKKQLRNQPYAGALFKASLNIAGLPLWQFLG